MRVRVGKIKGGNANAITAKENDFAHPTKLEARSAEAFTYFFFGGGLGPWRGGSEAM